MAKRIHNCWAATLQEKFAQEEQSIQCMLEQGMYLSAILHNEARKNTGKLGAFSNVYTNKSN